MNPESKIAIEALEIKATLFMTKILGTINVLIII